MLSTAMSRKPSAISSRLLAPPSASATSCSRAREASGSSGWSPSGPNTAGKLRRVDPAEEQVAVGDGQRPAVAVAGRARARARRTAGRRGSAFRRSGRSSRRRPRPCGSASSARGCARRRRRFRRPARSGRHNATRRSRCRPCRSRSACRRRAAALAATMPTTPPAGPDRIASLPRNARRFGEAAVGLHEVEVGRRPPSPAATRST